MNDVVSVMDVGGSHVTAANVDLRSRGIVSGQLFRESLDGDGSADEIVATLVRCARRLPAPATGRWAIALPGPFDHERGIGRYEGVGKFEALRDLDLRAALAALLPAAAGSISFHHDADAFLVGEWWAGAARGHNRAVGITLGTGVGSSFLRDGTILRAGPGIPPEGRVDLLRYAGLPLEETVSRRAIRRAYAGASSGLDVHEIAQRARQGDRAAVDVFTRAFRALGAVLDPYLRASGATVLVVGGSIAASWDLVAGPLRTATTVAIEPARHLAEAPLLGAAYLMGISPRGR